MTEQRYPIPGQTHRVEEEIRRSRFITTVAHAPSVEEARAFIAQVSAEFGDASHNCWAYVVGTPGNTAQVGMSDDGEPHGTAGRPMLTVLLHSGVGDIAAVVTRYFGGTLLGKGGLVKAYSGGVQFALESLPLAEHVPTSRLTVAFDYTHVTLFQRMLPDFEAEVMEESYAADVTVILHLPTAQVDAFTGAMTSLTHGQAIILEEPLAE